MESKKECNNGSAFTEITMEAVGGTDTSWRLDNKMCFIHALYVPLKTQVVKCLSSHFCEKSSIYLYMYAHTKDLDK